MSHAQRRNAETRRASMRNLVIPRTPPLVYVAPFQARFEHPTMRLSFALSMFMLASTALIPHAWAEGVLNAVLYQAFPADLSVAVRPFDDSEDNMALKERIERALAAKGISSRDDSDHILNFEVRDHIGSLSSGDNRHILSFQTSGGRGGGENTEARVNVFNSKDGGLLNRGRGDRVSNHTVYRLEMNIEQRASGERVWDGWAEAELPGGDSRDLLRRMVPALVKNIGRTVKREPLAIY